MPIRMRALQLRQLDETLSRYTRLRELSPPRGGWLKAIRSSLGMTTYQLAKRLRVGQSAVVALERSEAKGTVTLSKLQKAADALDCDVVYAIVPRKPLADMLHDKIREAAWRKVNRTAHTMALEAQDVSEDHLRRLVDEMVERAMADPPRDLWA